MNISIFKNMTSKLPLPGLLEGVANLIRTDEKLKAFIASYRQTGSKTFKSECPLFAVACTFEGEAGFIVVSRTSEDMKAYQWPSSMMRSPNNP